MGAVQTENEIFGEGTIRNSGNFYKNHSIIWSASQEDYLHLRNILVEKIRQDNEWARRYCQENLAKMEAFVREKPLPADLSRAAIHEWIHSCSLLTGYGYVTDAYSYADYEWIREYIPGLSAEDFAVLTSSPEPSFSKNYELAVARAAIEQATPEQIMEIQKAYHYALDNYDVIGRITEEKVREDLARWKPEAAQKFLNENDEHFQVLNERRETLFKTLRLDGFKTALLQAFSHFVDLTDKRKAVALVTNNLASKVFDEYLSSKGFQPVEIEEIMYGCLPYWISDREPKELLSLARESEKGCLWMVNQEAVLGEDAVQAFEKMDNSADNSIQEVKGFPASRGIVKGTARIIRNISDFPLLKEGDILITPMTTPEFVPIMRQAAAFVTDQGGITCHAAIISREMKKPCIIGTRIATKVFQNGDQVEVDANSGVIRKLS